MTNSLAWDCLGFVGQGVFTARFVVQWLASEKKRDSVVPPAFWWLSLLGGMLVLVYAIHIQSWVFIVGQSLGLFVYVRNLVLVCRKKRLSDRSKELAPPPHLSIKRDVTSEQRQG